MNDFILRNIQKQQYNVGELSLYIPSRYEPELFSDSIIFYDYPNRELGDSIKEETNIEINNTTKPWSEAPYISIRENESNNRDLNLEIKDESVSDFPIIKGDPLYIKTNETTQKNNQLNQFDHLSNKVSIPSNINSELGNYNIIEPLYPDTKKSTEKNIAHNNLIINKNVDFDTLQVHEQEQVFKPEFIEIENYNINNGQVNENTQYDHSNDRFFNTFGANLEPVNQDVLPSNESFAALTYSHKEVPITVNISIGKIITEKNTLPIKKNITTPLPTQPNNNVSLKNWLNSTPRIRDGR